MNKPRNKKGKFILIKPKLLVKKPSKELAEFIGVMLGDGCITPSRKNYRGYKIRICGHSENDKNYLLNYINPLSEKLFGVRFDTYYHSSKKSIYLTKSNKNLYYTLLHFGLKSGNKKTNNVKIPDWVFSNREYIKSCIRGLIDTDGSVSPFTNRNYSIIWFKSAIPNLRASFSNAMALLGYRTSKWSGHSDTLQTYIGAKSLIRKYYKEVGFNNIKHKRRFLLP